MDFWYDVIDWIGGYLYEYAKPEEVQVFLERQGFKLLRFSRQAFPQDAMNLYSSVNTKRIFSLSKKIDVLHESCILY